MLRRYWKWGAAFFLLSLLAGGIYRYLHPAQSLSIVRILYPKGRAVPEYYVLHSSRLLGETLTENSELCVNAYSPGLLGIQEEVYGREFPYLIRYENLPPKWLNKPLTFTIQPEGLYEFAQTDGKKIEGQLGRYHRIKSGGIIVEKGIWPELTQQTEFTVQLNSPAVAAKSWRNRRRISFGANQSRQVKLAFSDQFPHRGEKMLRSFIDVYARRQQLQAQDSLIRSLETVNWLMTQSDAQLRDEGGLPDFIYPEHGFRKKQEEGVNVVNQKEDRLLRLAKKRKILGRMEGVFLNEGLDQEWAAQADSKSDSLLMGILAEWRTMSLNAESGEQIGETEFQSLRKQRDVAIRRREVELEAEMGALKNETSVAHNWLLDLSASEAMLWDYNKPGERLKALAWKKYTELVREKIRIEEKLNHYSPNFTLVYESGSEPHISAVVMIQNFIVCVVGGLSFIFLGLLLYQSARPKHALPEELRYRTGFPIATKMKPLPAGKPELDQLQALLKIKGLTFPGTVAVCGAQPNEHRNAFAQGLAEAFTAAGVKCQFIDRYQAETPTAKSEYQVQLIHTLPPKQDPATWEILHQAQKTLYYYQVGKSSTKDLISFSKQAKELGWKHVEIVFVEDV